MSPTPRRPAPRPAQKEAAARALAALRGFSPGGARLLEAFPELQRAIDTTPSTRALQRTSNAGMRQALRRLRRRTLIHTIHRELAGWSPLETAAVWSDVADGALRLADRVAADETAARLGAMRPGRAILGLGKLGSRELNPSSDIDIVCVYDNDDDTSDQGVSAHEWHTDWARRVRSILADVSDDGFVFRVDFDLRPEGTRGPLVNSIDATERYYERFGRLWERVALLRMRAVVDIGGTGRALLQRLTPFVFKRSFDARVVDELFSMKARLEDAVVRRLEHGYDVKRGVGGIREVEFIAQSLVLLHAGRIPDLRKLQAAPTTTQLEVLEDHDLLPFRTARDLREAYAVLRRVEHAIQYGEDRQTQELPNDGGERERILTGVALGLEQQEGQPWRVLLDEETTPDPVVTSDGAGSLGDIPVSVALAERVFDAARSVVHEAFVRHLGEDRDRAPDAVRLALDLEEDDEVRIAALGRAGYPDPARAFSLLRLLERRRGGPFSPTLRVDPRARRFIERIVELMGHAVDPMTAFERLVDLFPGRAHPLLLERLSTDRTVAVVARLLALSAPLSRSLARLARIGRVDETLLFAIDSRRPSVQRLLRLMGSEGGTNSDDGSTAGTSTDDEAAVARLWLVKQEAILAAALPFVARLSPSRDDDSAMMVSTAVVDAQRRLSIVAEACIQRALQIAERRLARRHGTLPDARFSVLALGSLGGRELGFFRDLDLAFVYDVADEDALSDGARPIPASEWAVRLAQQVLWVLTAPVAADPLYPVDTRLRPSGSHGALTTSLARFQAYHAVESALWERQSLLRLRPVAGDRSLGVEAVRCARDALRRPSAVDVGSALIQMRTRMVEERAARRGFDLKLGRGGIADIEFAVQGAQLAAAVDDPGVLTASTRRALTRLSARGHIDANDALLLRLGLDRLVRLRELLNVVDDLRPGVVAFGDDRVATLVASGAIPEATSGDDAVAEVGDIMGEIAVVARRVLEQLPATTRRSPGSC